MNDKTHGPGPGFGNFARKLFDSLMQFDGLTSADRSKPSGVAFSRLYEYATDPDAVMDDAMQKALEQDSRLARNLDRLMIKTSDWRLPQAIAASTDPISRREGMGCLISFRESKANPEQIYVIIEFEDLPTRNPGALFVKTSDDIYQKFPLPEPDGGTIQILTHIKSDLVRTLRDVGSEIFLR